MAQPPYLKERGKIVLGSEDSPIGFCKVRVPKYLEGNVNDLPFAEIQAAIGNRQNEGEAPVVKKGDLVWVELHQSEASPKSLKVIVVGSAYSTPQGLPNYPHDAFDGPLTLHKRHLIPRDDEGNVHEDFEEPKRYVKGRSIPVIVQEGISWVIQNGQSILTHLKSLSHLIFSESGSIDLFSTKNLFIRARRNLHIWGNRIKFKGETIEFDLDELFLELARLGIDAKQINLKADGIAKIIAGAIQLSATGDLILSAQGKISQDAVGSYHVKVGQDLVNESLKAWSAQLMAAGSPIAELGIEATLGKIIAENLQGSIKGQLDTICDEIMKVIDEINNAVLKTGTGDGVVHPKTKSKLVTRKPIVAKIKVKNSLIMK